MLSKYVTMCVCMFLCACFFACVCVCECLLCVCLHLFGCVCLCICVYVFVRMCVRTCARTYVCIFFLLTDLLYKSGGDISTVSVRMTVYLFHISYPRTQVYGTRINNLRNEKPAYPYFIIDWPSSSMINLISWSAKSMTIISRLL